jgi:hypothetical protein
VIVIVGIKNVKTTKKERHTQLNISEKWDIVEYKSKNYKRLRVLSAIAGITPWGGRWLECEEK